MKNVYMTGVYNDIHTGILFGQNSEMDIRAVYIDDNRVKYKAQNGLDITKIYKGLTYGVICDRNICRITG